MGRHVHIHVHRTRDNNYEETEDYGTSEGARKAAESRGVKGMSPKSVALVKRVGKETHARQAKERRRWNLK